MEMRTVDVTSSVGDNAVGTVTAIETRNDVRRVEDLTLDRKSVV